MALNVATLVARVVADTSNFNRGMAETQSRLAETGMAMQRTGRALTTSVTVPLLITAGAAVKFGIDFQQQMEMIHTQAGASQAEVDRMSKAVLGLAPATAFGPVKLAEALYHIESVGDHGARAMEVLKVAAEGAAVGGSNLEDTASALVGTLRVYHLAAGDAANVMGDLNAIVGAGNMRMQDLNNAISTGLLPTASGLGVGLKEIGASLATMTDESVPAQVAATRLRTLLLLMTGETKKSRDTLAQLGITSGELGNKMRQPGGMIPALQDLRTHLDHLSKTDQVKVLAEAFGGSRSAGTIIQLLNNLGMVQTKLDQINKTAGNFPEDVLRTQATDAFKLHQAWAAIQTVLIQVGGILAPFVVQIAEAVSRAAEAFGKLNPHLQKMIVFGAMIAAALGPVIWIIGTVMTTIDALGAVLAAVFSGPGLIIAGIAAVVIGLIALYNHSAAVRQAIANLLDTLRSDGMAVFNAIRGVISALAGTVSGMGITWQRVGRDVSQALGVVRNIVDTVLRFVIQMFNEMASGIRAHSAEIRAFIQTTWNAIQTIFRTVMPIITAVVRVAWSLIKTIIETAMKVIGNIILAVMDLISGNWSGAWNAIKAATGALLHGIATVIMTILTGVIPIVLHIAELIGQALWDGIKKVGELLGHLAMVLISAIGRAIAEAASWAGHAAASIGSNIVHGIIGGVTSLPGELAGKLHGMVSGAISSVSGLLGIHSPSTVTRDKLGKPLAEGIIEGYLLGISQLPSKMNQTLRTALENARNVIQNAQQMIGTAFQRLSDYAFRAFDARTQQHLAQMQTKFDALVKSKITDPLKKAMDALDVTHQGNLDAITGTQNALTPSEAALQSLQDSHAEAQRQDAIQQAKDALATAQAGGDQAGIVQAQKDLQGALYDETVAGLQKSADAERTAANAKAKTDQDNENAAYKTSQDALQLRYDTLQAALQKTYDRQVLNYNAERDLQKQHLQDLLTTLETQLEKHPQMWQRDHNRIMTLFRDAFGPGYRTAGLNLGNAFAQGLREAFGSVRSAASELAAEVAKYLKLKSPAEKGPLSDLHTWWRPFSRTLMSGLDQTAMASVTRGIVPPSGAGVGRTTQATIDPSSIADALGRVLAARDASPLIGEYHDHTGAGAESVAVTIGRKLAIR